MELLVKDSKNILNYQYLFRILQDAKPGSFELAIGIFEEDGVYYINYNSQIKLRIDPAIMILKNIKFVPNPPDGEPIAEINLYNVDPTTILKFARKDPKRRRMTR